MHISRYMMEMWTVYLIKIARSMCSSVSIYINLFTDEMWLTGSLRLRFKVVGRTLNNSASHVLHLKVNNADDPFKTCIANYFDKYWRNYFIGLTKKNTLSVMTRPEFCYVERDWGNTFSLIKSTLHTKTVKQSSNNKILTTAQFWKKNGIEFFRKYNV